MEVEKDFTLLAIKQCLEGDELLEDIQTLHPIVEDIRFNPIGSDVQGGGRIDEPIETVPVDSLNSTPFIIAGGVIALFILILAAYKRSNDEDYEDEDVSDDDYSLDAEVDIADAAKEAAALDFDQFSEKDVKDSIFTPTSTNDQSTTMTFDASDISGVSKTPNVSSIFQPTDNDLAKITEVNDELDLLPKGSMDFGSGEFV